MARALVWTHTFLLPSVHRHHNPSLSESENQATFYKCAHLHGHEYKVDVSFLSGPSGITQFAQRQAVIAKVTKEVFEPLKGQYLNVFFGNTSGEIIAQKLFARCLTVEGSEVVRVRVRETRKNSFSFAGDSLCPTG